MDDNTAPPFEVLVDKVEAYAKTSLELLKLRTIEKSADVVSVVAAQVIIALVVSLFFIFVNIGLALLIGEMLGKTYYGFFIIGGFYALLSLLAILLKNTCIIAPISNLIISQLLKEKKV